MFDKVFRSLVCTVVGLSFCVAIASEGSAFNENIEAKTIDENTFTKIYAKALEQETGAKVEVLKPLEIHVKHKNDFEGTTFLNN
ncbi:MAG: hypothetical protein K2X81_09455, partial [Candidatus Obscuribacterales bacterium]|nr:hypothetical protein [Candidatus Obscuribacterales bacterium]